MNTKALFAAAALLVAAGSTFAADTSEAAFDQAFRNNTGTSSLTREQVKAEVIAARKSGLLDINDAYQDVAYMAARQSQTRSADVKAQQLAAKQQAQDSSTH
jgi:predicted RNA-binding protein Jag